MKCTALGLPQSTGNHNIVAVEIVLWVEFGYLCHIGGVFLRGEHSSLFLPVCGKKHCCSNMEADCANVQNSIKLHSTLAQVLYIVLFSVLMTKLM